MNDAFSYKLGIIWQDVQHLRIAKIIKEVDSSSHINYASIFNQLTYYIEDHFGTEEQYMSMYGYDKIGLHVKEHNNFKNKFNEINDSPFIDESFNKAMSSFLNEWFYKHISEADNELAVFLLKHEPGNA